MSFGDFMALLVVTIGLVSAVGILGQAYRRRLEHKERLAEIRAQGGLQAAGPERNDRLERLEHRLRVLERIATDKTASLATQIENLREPTN